jgi:hypothetical protein
VAAWAARGATPASRSRGGGRGACEKQQARRCASRSGTLLVEIRRQGPVTRGWSVQRAACSVEREAKGALLGAAAVAASRAGSGGACTARARRMHGGACIARASARAAARGGRRRRAGARARGRQRSNMQPQQRAIFRLLCFH